MLSLGRKFALPINAKNFSALHIIANIEQCIQNIEEDEKETYRTKIANRITNFIRNFKNTTKEKFILTIFEKTRRFLKKHNDILIIQADKGNKTVAIYKNEYYEKINKLLEEEKYIQKIKN